MNNISMNNMEWFSESFEKGLFTVIVPAYNRAHTIIEALDSVWAQTYRPIELIVVDDGSQDDTAQVVEDWLHAHPDDDRFNAKLVRKQNGGAHSARNYGFQFSKGEYFLFLDSDDAFYPGFVERAAKEFAASLCDYVIVGYDKLCHACRRLFYTYIPAADVDPWIMYMKGILFGNSISIARTRSLIRQIGPWDESLINDADGNYLVRTILQSRRMGVVRERLFAYYVRKGAKLSDAKGSHQSWMCYIRRETMFCEKLADQTDIPAEARDAYAQRLYKRALSLYNGGFADIGEAFGSLADQVLANAVTPQTQRLQFFWRRGRKLFALYSWARNVRDRLRKWIAQKKKGAPPCPVCGR